MIARYPLSEYVASFDFFDWLVMVQAKGATEIVFDVSRLKTTKWKEAVVRERFRSIIEPGPALAGLPSRIGTDGDTMMSPHMREIIKWVRAGGTFQRLKSVLPPGNARYTVTIRRDKRIPQRNSNEPAWRQFASEIGAVVIEDFEVEPIGLHERFAMYAGAEQNFGVPNGPLHLIGLSNYPMMMFDCQDAVGGFESAGMEFGSQYPWALKNQIAVWEPDDLEVIRRRFDEWARRSS